MTAQPILFPVGRARASDPSTSHEAAVVISGRTELLILDAFGDPRQGITMTDDQLADWLSLAAHTHPPTVKSARSRLSRAGLLVDSGERRPSNRGRQQIVWRLA